MGRTYIIPSTFREQEIFYTIINGEIRQCKFIDLATTGHVERYTYGDEKMYYQCYFKVIIAGFNEPIVGKGGGSDGVYLDGKRLDCLKFFKDLDSVRNGNYFLATIKKGSSYYNELYMIKENYINDFKKNSILGKCELGYGDTPIMWEMKKNIPCEVKICYWYNLITCKTLYCHYTSYEESYGIPSNFYHTKEECINNNNTTIFTFDGVVTLHGDEKLTDKQNEREEIIAQYKAIKAKYDAIVNNVED